MRLSLQAQRSKTQAKPATERSDRRGADMEVTTVNPLDRRFLRIAKASSWTMRRTALDGRSEEQRMARACLRMSADFNENHSAENGQFTSGGGGGSGGSSGGRSEGKSKKPDASSQTPEERLQNVAKSSIMKSSDGVKIKGYSSHVLDRMKERDIDEASMEDAIKHPLHITPDKIDSTGQPSRQYIGKKVTAAVNPETGVITTCWPTSSQRRRKYGGE